MECNIQEWNAERCKLSRAVARFAGRNDVRMARVHSKHWDAKILFSDEQIQLVYHVEWFVFCTVYNFRNFPLGNEHKTKTNWHNASSSASVSRLGHTYTLVKGYWYFKYNFSTAETIASYSLRLPTSKLIKTSTWSFWYPLPLACSHESLARSITSFCQNYLHCTCNNNGCKIQKWSYIL